MSNKDLDPLAIPHFRDFVAVSALGGILSNEKYNLIMPSTMANLSYSIADAFLKERDKKDAPPTA